RASPSSFCIIASLRKDWSEGDNSDSCWSWSSKVFLRSLISLSAARSEWISAYNCRASNRVSMESLASVSPGSVRTPAATVVKKSARHDATRIHLRSDLRDSVEVTTVNLRAHSDQDVLDDFDKDNCE